MKLTKQERVILDVIDFDSYPVRGRETFASDRPDYPWTVGIRSAFDDLVCKGLIEPVTQYRLTEAGRAALQERTNG
jgi:hypothetical protein